MADRIKNTTKLKLIGFLYGVHFYMPIISLYFLLGGASLQSIVISQTLYSIFSFLGELPTGIFADKFGQKLSMIMGYFVETIGLLFMLPELEITSLSPEAVISQLSELALTCFQ